MHHQDDVCQNKMYHNNDLPLIIRHNIIHIYTKNIKFIITHFELFEKKNHYRSFFHIKYLIFKLKGGFLAIVNTFQNSKKPVDYPLLVRILFKIIQTLHVVFELFLSPSATINYIGD